MNSAGDQPLAVRRVGGLTIEEFPASFTIYAPRRFIFSVLILALFGVLSLISSLPAQTNQQRRERQDGAVFYMSFAAIVVLFRLTMRNVITVSESGIAVSHRNFGLTWWKNHYQLDRNCNLTWIPARRKASSALELSCGKRKARFAFEITQEEATQVLELLTQRFTNLRKSSGT